MENRSSRPGDCKRYLAGAIHLTINADWSWWTWFLVDRIAIYGNCVVEYDLTSRSITYLRPTSNDWALNPYGKRTPEYQRWMWDRISGTFDAIWIDPNKSFGCSIEDSNKLELGEKPDSFLELTGQDPQEYFAGIKICLASYEPHALQERLRQARQDHNPK